MRKEILYILVVLIYVVVLGLSFFMRTYTFSDDTSELELVYFPSSSIIKPFLMDFSMIFADYLWFQGIQYYGGHAGKAKELGNIYRVFDVLTDIDKRFINAYTFGSLILLYDINNAKLAYSLLLKGWQNNPENWYIPYTMGFFYYVYFKDYVKAARLFRLSSNYPDAPSFVKKFEIFCYQYKGDYRAAFEMWKNLYLSSDNKMEKMMALKNMLTLVAGYFYYEKGVKKGRAHLFGDIYLVMKSDSAYLFKNGEEIFSLPKKRILVVSKRWFHNKKEEEDK